MSNVIETNSARFCHIIKREDFDGYGFNLHAEKGKPGQYIGKVDDNSPAEAAGLKQGDRIIEVNAVNIGNETHKQVVQRIKAIACEVRLLVVDSNVVPLSNNNQVLDSNSFNNTTNSLDIDQINGNKANDGVNASINGRNGQTTPSADSRTPSQSSSLPPASVTSSIVSGKSAGDSLNLKMTAAELRAKLAAKKKYDPKNDSVDLRKKYEIVQKL